jgi:hypothetical protein
MSHELKEIKIKIPLALYEELYRKFPLRGEIQSLILGMLAKLIERTKTDKTLFKDIVESLRG